MSERCEPFVAVTKIHGPLKWYRVKSRTPRLLACNAQRNPSLTMVNYSMGIVNTPTWQHSSAVTTVAIEDCVLEVGAFGLMSRSQHTRVASVFGSKISVITALEGMRRCGCMCVLRGHSM